MKQMITRLDDDLHARLKAQAKADGRSVNDLMIEVLAAALDDRTKRQAIRERLRSSGRLVVPEPPRHTPSRAEALAATRGIGAPVSAALAADRAAR